MTKAQYEREQIRLAREKELRILAEAERNADPRYVIDASGFAIERWGGKRHARRGRKETPCPTNSSMSASVPVENSGFLLST